jgi:hypothetical protein
MSSTDERPPAAEGAEKHWTAYPWYDDRGQLGYLQAWSNDLATLLQDEIIEDDVPQEVLITAAVTRLLAARPAPPSTAAERGTPSDSSLGDPERAALDRLEAIHHLEHESDLVNDMPKEWDECPECFVTWPCDTGVLLALARRAGAAATTGSTADDR